MDTLQPTTQASLPPPNLSRMTRTSSGGQASTVRQLASFILPIAAVIVLAVTLQQIAQPDVAAVYRDPLIRLVTLAAVLLAIGLLAVHQYQLMLPSTLTPIGVAFTVLVAFAIALVETAVPLSADRPVLGISAVGPWIVFISLLVGGSPATTLAAGLVAATMWPV